MRPRFFATPSEWRTWLDANHDTAKELWVGFRKRNTGKPSITWPQSVDEALCYGWIDGVRRSLDEENYVIRFTPRKRGSIWSAVNAKRAKELSKLGLMQPAGLSAFRARRPDKMAIYSYERRTAAALDPVQERQFRANEKGWAFFQSQAPWYRRAATHWVTSAKKEETKAKRLGILIKDSESGRRIGPLSPNRK